MKVFFFVQSWFGTLYNKRCTKLDPPIATHLTIPQQMWKSTDQAGKPLVRHSPYLLMYMVEVDQQELSVAFELPLARFVLHFLRHYVQEFLKNLIADTG